MNSNRIPFGEEEPKEPWYIPPAPDYKCPDCSANNTELHDPGCDVEQCPECGQQLIGCEHASEILEAA